LVKFFLNYFNFNIIFIIYIIWIIYFNLVTLSPELTVSSTTTVPCTGNGSNVQATPTCTVSGTSPKIITVSNLFN
jgi:ABC-type multidrug transport system permease subunit